VKLQEAMEKATRGRVSVEHEFNLVDEEGQSLTGLQANYKDTHVRNVTNAALLAHWWNHGPKLLEALKIHVAECNEFGWECGEFVDAIAAAEEVEGI
jgi:hypothetical protein